jgi:anti-sigma B factor antagonist
MGNVRGRHRNRGHENATRTPNRVVPRNGEGMHALAAFVWAYDDRYRRPGPGASLAGGRLDALRLSSEHRGDSVVVTVCGALDVVASGQFDACLACARRERNHVIIDLAEVDFMDTSSLAVIVGHWKKLVASGGTLALAGARYKYTKALWITGLADRLPFYESVEQVPGAGPVPPPADLDSDRRPDLAGDRRPGPAGDAAADGAMPA